METPDTFVAVNYIEAEPEYIERFEMLFKSRAHAIDTSTGFQSMHVLKPNNPEDAYLIVSYWDSEDQFKAWNKSPAFTEGHKRGFGDMKAAHKEGTKPPMKSTYKTYTILTR
jgi:heme oxygenase (mycobilin-producing)